MHVHWVVTYRRGVFTAQILHDLHIFASVCLDVESQRVEFDAEDDPVHLLVNYPPKIAVATPRELPQGTVQSAHPAEELPEHPAQQDFEQQRTPH